VESILDIPCFSCLTNIIVSPFGCDPATCLKLDSWLQNETLPQISTKPSFSWSENEVNLFIKLWNKDPAYNELQKSFPNRTRIALVKKATELKRTGIIENAFVVRAKLQKGEPLKQVSEIKLNPPGNPNLARFDDYLWTSKERAVIIKFWLKKKTIVEIHQEVRKLNPNRTKAAVTAEIQRLQDKKIIPPRTVWRKNLYRVDVTRLKQIAAEVLTDLSGQTMTVGEFCKQMKVDMKRRLRK